MPPPPAPAAGGAEPFGAEGGLAQSSPQDRRILTQAVQTNIQAAINQARGQMMTDPDAAIQNLRLKLEDLRQQRDLIPEVREQLTDALETALRDGSRRRTELTELRLERQAQESAAKKRQLLVANLQRTQDHLRQLMDRFDSLMKEGRYRWAEEGPAYEASKIIAQCDGIAGKSGGCRRHAVVALMRKYSGPLQWKSAPAAGRDSSTRWSRWRGPRFPSRTISRSCIRTRGFGRS